MKEKLKDKHPFAYELITTPFEVLFADKLPLQYEQAIECIDQVIDYLKSESEESNQELAPLAHELVLAFADQFDAVTSKYGYVSEDDYDAICIEYFQEQKKIYETKRDFVLELIQCENEVAVTKLLQEKKADKDYWKMAVDYHQADDEKKVEILKNYKTEEAAKAAALIKQVREKHVVQSNNHIKLALTKGGKSSSDADIAQVKEKIRNNVKPHLFEKEGYLTSEQFVCFDYTTICLLTEFYKAPAQQEIYNVLDQYGSNTGFLNAIESNEEAGIESDIDENFDEEELSADEKLNIEKEVNMKDIIPALFMVAKKLYLDPLQGFKEFAQVKDQNIVDLLNYDATFYLENHVIKFYEVTKPLLQQLNSFYFGDISERKSILISCNDETLCAQLIKTAQCFKEEAIVELLIELSDDKVFHQLFDALVAMLSVENIINFMTNDKIIKNIPLLQFIIQPKDNLRGVSLRTTLLNDKTTWEKSDLMIFLLSADERGYLHLPNFPLTVTAALLENDNIKQHLTLFKEVLAAHNNSLENIKFQINALHHPVVEEINEEEQSPSNFTILYELVSNKFAELKEYSEGSYSHFKEMCNRNAFKIYYVMLSINICASSFACISVCWRYFNPEPIIVNTESCNLYENMFADMCNINQPAAHGRY